MIPTTPTTPQTTAMAMIEPVARPPPLVTMLEVSVTAVEFDSVDDVEGFVPEADDVDDDVEVFVPEADDVDDEDDDADVDVDVFVPEADVDVTNEIEQRAPVKPEVQEHVPFPVRPLLHVPLTHAGH